MTFTDLLKAFWPALPMLLVGILILLSMGKRRKNGRPPASCSLCGQKFQRGLAMQFHMDQAHAPKGKKR